MTNFFDRIMQVAEYKGYKNPSEFAKRGLGWTSSEKINRLKDESKKPSVDILIEISNKFDDVNLGWLLTGKGEMLKEEEILPVAVHTNNPKKGIPLIPVEAMAGIANGEVSVLEMDCERYIIPMFKDADYLIMVKGDSMYPRYSSGDVVACKKLPLSDLFFQWNKPYVIDTDQGGLIKKVCKSTKKNCIKLVSENPEYEPFDLHKSQIYAIALVIGTVRLE
jgi:hypothetical protein bfra3_16308|nr:MAG TPA: putative transcriptional regulator [Caudoviricetes sp.]